MPEFLTYKQQVEKISEIGILVEPNYDILPALKFHGYDKILTDYIKLLIGLNPEISFKDIETLVMFDFDLQSLLFKYIIQTESTLKTLFSHQIGKKIGIKKDEYLNAEKYIKSKIVNAKINFINKKFIKRSSFSKKPFSNYTDENKVPPWLYFSQVDLGDFINLYSVIDTDIKHTIANELISSKRAILIDDKNELVISGIKYMHSFRNKIAHGQHCFSFSTDKVVKFDIISSLCSSTVLSKSEFMDIKNRIFIIFLLIIILNPYELIRNNFIADIKNLYDSYHNKYGNDFISYFHSVSGIPQDFIFRINTLDKSIW